MARAQRPGTALRKPLQQRARTTVEVVIEASAQVLQAHGYKGATTNRIADRAGVSVGTIYQYFRNKDEIFDALIEAESQAYLAALECHLPAREVPLREALHTLLAAGYAHHRLVLGLTEVMRHVPSTVYARRSRAIRTALHALVVRFLESRAPIRGIDDVALMADVLVAQCEGLTFLGRVERSPQELIAILTDSFMRLLRADGSRVPAPRGR